MKSDSDNVNDDTKKGSFSPRRVIVALLLFLVIYPLSAGPALWLMTHGYVGLEHYGRIEGAYRPAGAVLRMMPEPIQGAFAAYVQWWTT
jgi:hypothetical protein